MQQKHRRQRQTTTGCPLSLLLAGFTHLQAQNMFTGSITCHLLSLSNWKWQLLHIAFPAEREIWLVVLCFSKYSLHQLGPLALHKQLLKRPQDVVAINLHCILRLTVANENKLGRIFWLHFTWQNAFRMPSFNTTANQTDMKNADTVMLNVTPCPSTMSERQPMYLLLIHACVATCSTFEND